MKAVAAITLLSAAAQAAYTTTDNGVTYTVTYRDADGSELPVVFGPKIDGEARAAARAQRRIQKRSQTSNNWCGYANRSPPNGTFNSVTGSWTVPTVSLREGQTNDTQPSLVQWIGIDGDGCSKGGLIQGGSGSLINTQGTQENYAWFEFVPATLRTFTMDVSTGDQMSGVVTAGADNASGNVTITNVSTGKTMNYEFTSQGDKLCGTSAEWILEDLQNASDHSLRPFANFPDTSFSSCSAKTTTGDTAGPGDNDVNISQDGVSLCTASASGSTVYVHSVPEASP